MRKIERIQKLCKLCGKEIWLHPKRIKETGNFCSMSCNAKYYGHLKPPPQKIKKITEAEYSTLQISITLAEFNELPNKEIVELKCCRCSELFRRRKELIVRSFEKHGKCGYCSTSCHNKAKINKLTVNCHECGKEIEVRYQSWNKNKNHYCFCSYSCATKHRNKNKTSGYKRSKMEFYLEEKIKAEFLSLEVICNDQKVLAGLELDFYFPSLKLAFELNGITHYEPIYGLDRFSRSQDSDRRKMIQCNELGIELAVIDISSYKYFSKKSGDRIWTEIQKILSPLYEYAITRPLEPLPDSQIESQSDPS